MNYKFPVKDRYKAREVLEIDFDILPYFEQLYVDLDQARESEEANYKEEIKEILKIDLKTNILNSTEILKPNKILLAGFRGIGKTTELRRLKDDLHKPASYYVVYIPLGDWIDVGTFQYQDFFVSVIMNLTKILQEEKKLKKKANLFDNILEDWLTDQEINKEVTNALKLQADGGVGTEIKPSKLLDFFKLEFDLRGAFEYGTNTVKVLRRKINETLPLLIRKLNDALADLRAEIIKAGLAKDLLLVVDDLEKVSYDEFIKLFLHNQNAIFSLNVNMIATAPMNMYFEAERMHQRNRYDTVIFPVIRTDKKENIKLLEEVVKRRIDVKQFFENEDVLEFFVKKSGGILAQLFNILRFTLVRAKGEKIDLSFAKRHLKVYGQRQFDSLNREQRKVLKDLKYNKEFIPGDSESAQLLFSGYVLKYNGNYIVNPIVEQFV